MNRTTLAALAAVALSVTTAAAAAPALAAPTGSADATDTTARAKARNVIVFVGDGMGTSHRNLIRYANVGADRQLHMDSMPYAGRSETFPHDPKAAITDSAAGGTAIATGVKTYNGAIGVDVDGNPVQSVLELAAKHGKATGLVTTSQVTDATPAAFGAHVKDRGEQSLIAKQYLENSKPQVILGGGEDRWLPPGTPGAFPDAPAEDPKEKSSGTEGNLIEKAHKSNATQVIKAGANLDAAVGVAKRYAKAHGDTLVIVVADHETGGLTIEDVPELQDDPGYPNERGEGRTAEDGPFTIVGTDKKVMVDWTTSNHSAEDVPVTAMGPGGQRLVGVYQNTHVHDAMVKAMGLPRR